MRKQSDFKPAWWLTNRHLQSCFSSILPYRARITLDWEELILPDGDFIDVAWAGPEDRPLIILLHGLEGSVNSHYIQLMIDSLVAHGWRLAVMHYRTCSGRINRLPQSYNGGDVTDLSYFMNILRERFPNKTFYAIGFSLGGNLLMHYLAKHPKPPIRAAIAVSIPYEMNKSADHLPSFYQHVLLRSMKAKVFEKIKLGYQMPVSLRQLKSISNLRQFDTMITAPLYGYPTVEHYYEAASCRYILKFIQQPTLILHALDDPFVPPETVPFAHELSSYTILEVSNKGGHVGFIAGGTPLQPRYWLQLRILQYLRNNTST